MNLNGIADKESQPKPSSDWGKEGKDYRDPLADTELAGNPKNFERIQKPVIEEETKLTNPIWRYLGLALLAGLTAGYLILSQGCRPSRTTMEPNQAIYQMKEQVYQQPLLVKSIESYLS